MDQELPVLVRTGDVAMRGTVRNHEARRGALILPRRRPLLQERGDVFGAKSHAVFEFAFLLRINR